MRIFFSYARSDEARIRILTDGIGDFGHDVWFDRQLAGGVEWWPEILRRIRRADVLVAAVSRASISSTACRREWDYALALGKPLLPLLLEVQQPHSLPSTIAERQLIDFSSGTAAAAFALARTLRELPASPPLPYPLPTEPPAPSAVTNMRELLDAPELGLAQQTAIVTEIRRLHESPATRRESLHIAAALRRREDLLLVTDRNLREFVPDEVDVPPAPPPAEGSFTEDDRIAVRELRASFRPRTYGPGYNPWQVERLFDEIQAAMDGGPVPVSISSSEFASVRQGYDAADVDEALRQVRKLFSRTLRR
ncbi:toll/interleukin-1 receptor domain-containing protein [Cryptosporangium sp. NPDC051539]|uniref:toll/interleukin-1 receptor domain-containing protein n=1 Tax=Cryptosporangium sp. NPDC051539 TaxID=3363962 RepID=UPI0037B37A20